MTTTTLTYRLSNGDTITVDMAEATCARCGERSIRIGGGAWGHANALVGRPRRSFLGSKYDHDPVVDDGVDHRNAFKRNRIVGGRGLDR